MHKWGEVYTPLLFIICLIILLSPLPCSAKTLILDGRMESSIKTTQQINFDVPKKVATLSFRFAVPATSSNRATSQNIEGLTIKITPEPQSLVDETDKFGNKFKKAKWKDLAENITITISFNANIKSELNAMESQSPFPPSNITDREAVFLKPSSMVQSGNEDIIAVSRRLTEGSASEYEAVSAILNWVSDNVRYTYNPPEYDALYTLKTGTGNCQNFAHLTMALLRAAGIPSRIVGGITLKRQWKVPVENGYLVQDMGQGGHAWIEIFFPDLGWLSYDPQQSRQFTSTRHIKQTHGLDSGDINDSWSAAPYLPAYSETIDAVFNIDEVDIRLNKSSAMPKSYIMSNNLIAMATVPPAEKAAVPPISEELTAAVPPIKGSMTSFGNMEFPALVDIYQISGNEGVRILDKETAEYVTSKYVYSQAFGVENTMALNGISLAMRKFGGDGTVYIDIVEDENGKPGLLSGKRSLPVFLSNIKYHPGYYWVDFEFAKGAEPPPVLKPGKYWIILRHSGEAIMNWFYIPGNPYGDGDDTRSTVKGYKWADILNYDFVFKVQGVAQ